MTIATRNAPGLPRGRHTPLGYPLGGAVLRLLARIGEASAARRERRARRKRRAHMEKLMAGLTPEVHRDIGWPVRYAEEHPEDFD